MALELVKDYQPDSEPSEKQSINQPTIDHQKFIDEVANAVAKKLAPQIEEIKQIISEPEDKILTQAQLNDSYFHARANSIVDLTKVPGFPKFYLPGQSTPRFSLKAVQQWAQEQKQTKKYV
jgi:hypothetical protein